jgi:hypothetical protein
MDKRYQRGNKKEYIKEGHSILLFLITSLISFIHSIECPSLIYCFLLPLWYLLTIVLYVLHWYTVSYYLFGIFWSLYWMSFFDILFLITSLVSFDHCFVCPSLIYCFLLPLWYILTIVLNVLLWSTVSYFLFGIFWPLYCMSFFDILFLITSLVSFDHCIVCPSLIYLRGNKKQYIKEGHSIQWWKDSKEVIRNSTSKKDIQYNGQNIPKR